MKLRLNFVFLSFIAVVTVSYSQELDSISMTFENNRVVINYDFLVGEEDVEYELFLFGSHDNFAEPLQEVEGDVGKKIRIGKGKTIYWNARKELGNFKGDFRLKIKGSKYIPLISFQNINNELQVKRGKNFNIEWDTNDKSDKVLLKIQRNGVPVFDPIVVENNGSYLWNVPANLKAGKGYSVQILDAKNLLREETSESFRVRRKIPFAYKIIPAALISGTIAYFIINQPEEGIPGPPDPPQ